MTLTVEHTDISEFQSLASQLKQSPAESKADEQPQAAQESKPASVAKARPFTIKKGEQTWDIDEDAVVEIMADKEPVSLTLRELKDRASGDIAVKKRMHSLAEEKKKVTGTLKQFSALAKKDPLQALEFISNKANEADSEFEFNKYVIALADQAQKVGDMSDQEKKVYEADKRLEAKQNEITLKEKELRVGEIKQDILDTTGVSEDVFEKALDTVLESPDLMEGVQDEFQALDRVEDFLIEVESQRIAYECIRDVSPELALDKNLVFKMSDVIQENEDFNEEDIREIVRGVLGDEYKQRSSQRLSNIQRESMDIPNARAQGVSDYQLLAAQLQENKQKRKR